MTVLDPARVRGAEANTQLAVGLIGCGGRGAWISELFRNHGGYRFVACADAFQDRVDALGDKLGIEPSRRFAGLAGYRRMLQGKLDAVVIESPPYFHPEHAAAATDAGCHVYLAKPIAVDVPGCRTIEQSGRRATANRKCFIVDFQTRANASYQEAVRRVHQGGIGKIVSGEATYICGPTWGGMEQHLRANPGSAPARLRAWGLDRTLSGDIITEQNIHALDVASWILNAAPLKAYGTGGKASGSPGTCWDHFSVVFQYPGGVLLSFSSKQMGHGWDDIQCRIYGTDGTIDTHYFGKVSVAGREDSYDGGTMKNLFTEGAVANIATFHSSILKGDWSNPTVAPSVRSNLTTILGRTAAYRRGEVTWDQLMRRNEKWDAKLGALRA
jgi:predicted dehydrogenase